MILTKDFYIRVEETGKLYAVKRGVFVSEDDKEYLGWLKKPALKLFTDKDLNSVTTVETELDRTAILAKVEAKTSSVEERLATLEKTVSELMGK